jgi:hypothetical protein
MFLRNIRFSRELHGVAEYNTVRARRCENLISGRNPLISWCLFNDDLQLLKLNYKRGYSLFIRSFRLSECGTTVIQYILSTKEPRNSTFAAWQCLTRTGDSLSRVVSKALARARVTVPSNGVLQEDLENFLEKLCSSNLRLLLHLTLQHENQFLK